MSTDRDGMDGGPQYRYLLWRQWGDGTGRILWVMLNPSTADHEHDDPTMRRVVAFSRSWGYQGCVVANLFALRSPDPRAIRWVRDPVGPQNTRHVLLALRHSDASIAAWGATKFPQHVETMRRRLMARGPVLCLAKSNSGAPVHPLARGKSRVPDSATAEVWCRR